MRNNKLKSYTFVCSLGTTVLKLLDLGQNKLQKIEALGESLLSLQSFYLDKNQLDSLSNISTYQSLTHLYL
jgi:Leucine-rich repeat (LRR) protein